MGSCCRPKRRTCWSLCFVVLLIVSISQEDRRFLEKVSILSLVQIQCDESFRGFANQSINVGNNTVTIQFTEKQRPLGQIDVFDKEALMTEFNSTADSVVDATSVNTNLAADDRVNNKMPLSIVVYLSGEMGNHMSKIAFGKYFQWRLRDEYGILDTELVLRHQLTSRGNPHGKYLPTRQDLQQCFHTVDDWWQEVDFAKGNQRKELKHRRKELHNLLDTDDEYWSLEDLSESHAHRAHMVQESLDHVAKFILEGNQTAGVRIDRPALDANISMPFVYLDVFAGFAEIDRYYDELRSLFQLNEDKCCSSFPAPDESVFHFRNFLTEMPRKGRKMGFEELEPNLTAFQLFGNLKPGTDRMALTSRFGNNASQAYLDAFTSRGVENRLVSGAATTSGVEDFCFLAKTQSELAGSRRSSYFIWAASLSNASRIRLYSIDSPATPFGHFSSSFSRDPYNFTFHPELNERYQFREFQQGG